MAHTTGPGNGPMLQKICISHAMVPMNQLERNPGKTARPLNAATLTSPDGNAHRQIDYVMISQNAETSSGKHTQHIDGEETWNNKGNLQPSKWK